MTELYEFFLCPAHGVLWPVLTMGALPFVFGYHFLKELFKLD